MSNQSDKSLNWGWRLINETYAFTQASTPFTLTLEELIRASTVEVYVRVDGHREPDGRPIISIKVQRKPVSENGFDDPIIFGFSKQRQNIHVYMRTGLLNRSELRQAINLVSKAIESHGK